jgi:uncharacterized membrane protein YfhO
LISLIDLWRIDNRAKDYIDNPEVNNLFTKPSYVDVIEKENNTEPFRILNIKQDNSPGSISANQNYNVSFLLEDFYGYSGIKPRSYQDFWDVVGPFNVTLWRMLNVKYIISEKPVEIPGLQVLYQDQKSTVSINNYVLPRAYFVESVLRESGLEFLNLVKRNAFDPLKTAYIENQNLIVDKPDSTAKVKISNYKNEYIQIEANSSGNNFLFLGNTFYPMGWEAKIDGKLTKTYKVNHGFVGLIVPKGKHEIEFIYDPKSFNIGKYLSLGINIVLLLLLIYLLVTKKWLNNVK